MFFSSYLKRFLLPIKKINKNFNFIKLSYRLFYFSFLEFIKSFFFFYLRKPFLFIVDLTVNVRFFFINPYKTLFSNSKKQLRNFNYLYGETPYSVWNKISKECEISSQDVVYDLGCGLGKLCFWTYLFIKCQKITGIDCSKSFILFANKLKQIFFFKENLIFLNEDFFISDLSDATVIYIYGSAFSLSVIKKLIEKLSIMPSGVKIITISYSLLDFKNSQNLFILIKKIPCNFSWGKTFAYVHYKQ